MFWGLITFLVGCLVLAVVLYVFKLILDMITLPDPIKQIVLIVVGLIALLILIGLTIHAFAGGFGPAPLGAPW